jgi:hypothetical protein
MRLPQGQMMAQGQAAEGLTDQLGQPPLPGDRRSAFGSESVPQESRALPSSSEAKSGKVVANKVEPQSLDVLARLSKMSGRGDIVFAWERPPNTSGPAVDIAARQNGVDRKTMRDIQAKALEKIEPAKSIIGNLNEIVSILEREGGAGMGAWSRLVEMTRRAGGDSSSVEAAVNAYANLGSFLSQYTMTQQERRVIGQVMGLIAQARNAEIKRSGGGAPTGADYAIASSILQSPAGADAARFGPRFFVSAVSPYMRGLYDQVHGLVSENALTQKVSAPHKWWAYGEKMAEIDSLIGAGVTGDKLKAAVNQIMPGIDPTQRDIQMLEAYGNLGSKDPIQMMQNSTGSAVQGIGNALTTLPGEARGTAQGRPPNRSVAPSMSERVQRWMQILTPR